MDAPMPNLPVWASPMSSTSFRPCSGSWDGGAGKNPAVPQGPWLSELWLEQSQPRVEGGKWS